jgi:hypothetical protein
MEIVEQFGDQRGFPDAAASTDEQEAHVLVGHLLTQETQFIYPTFEVLDQRTVNRPNHPCSRIAASQLRHRGGG